LRKDNTDYTNNRNLLQLRLIGRLITNSATKVLKNRIMLITSRKSIPH